MFRSAKRPLFAACMAAVVVIAASPARSGLAPSQHSSAGHACSDTVMLLVSLPSSPLDAWHCYVLPTDRSQHSLPS